MIVCEQDRLTRSQTYELLKNKQYDKVIEDNIRYVHYIIKKYFHSDYKYVSAGYEGLVIGVKTFDITKQIHLSTYLSRVICNAIMMEYGRDKKHLEVMSNNYGYYDYDGNECCIEDMIPSNDKSTDQIVWEKICFEKIDKILTDVEKQFLYGYYGIGNYEKLNQQQLAEKFNITQSYVSRRIQVIIEKLRRNMEDENIC